MISETKHAIVVLGTLCWYFLLHILNKKLTNTYFQRKYYGKYIVVQIFQNRIFVRDESIYKLNEKVLYYLWTIFTFSFILGNFEMIFICF